MMTTKIIPRAINDVLLSRLKHYPVVGIIGPRQAGKTTVSKFVLPLTQKPSVYLDLELASDLDRLREPEIFLKENEQRLVVIDEIQRMPELFPLLRAMVDQHRVNSRFLILGSASPELLRTSSESLAGRISYLELHPFQLNELPNFEFKTHWLRGGFPRAFLAEKDDVAFQWLEDFIRTIIERDLPMLGLNAHPIRLRNLLLMLTSVHGNLLNYSTLANSLGITGPTVKNYLNLLQNTFFTRQLFPFHLNIRKQLVKTPKFYFRDSGLLHRLSNINSLNDLFGHLLLGASWEGYVIQQILAVLPYSSSAFFYRTRDGAELDLVICQGIQPKVSIEIKFSNSPSLTKGNHHAFNDLKAPVNLIITPSAGDYPFNESIRVVDIQSLWKHLESAGVL